MKGKPKILAVVGPTASGKTALSIALAKKLNGEIVSADSRQIYRHMDIGTAKPPKDTRDKVQEARKNRESDSNLSPVAGYLSHEILHHLIDIKNPDQSYTAADYKRDAIRVIKSILKKKKLPIIVGGTGLYVRTVVENLDIPKVKENPALRKRLEADLKKRGVEALFQKLVAVDPEAAYIVDPHNPRRVIRALEVTLATGEPFTAQRQKSEPLFDAHIIGLKWPPAKLRQRIEARVDQMIKGGLIEETEKLFRKYGRIKALEAIGYREIIDYLEGKISLEEAVREIKLNTWHYAKRQMTWFRKEKNILWISPQKIPRLKIKIKGR